MSRYDNELSDLHHIIVHCLRFFVQRKQCAVNDCERRNRPSDFCFVPTLIGVCSIYLCDQHWREMQDKRHAALMQRKTEGQP